MEVGDACRDEGNHNPGSRVGRSYRRNGGMPWYRTGPAGSYGNERAPHEARTHCIACLDDLRCHISVAIVP